MGTPDPRSADGALRGSVPLRLVRRAAVALLLAFPIGAAWLTLNPDGWAINRLNVQIWIMLLGPVGLTGAVTPEQFATVMNVVLFLIPFTAVAILRPRWWWVLLGFAITCAIESWQWVIGSRDASLEDIVMNTLGAALGVALGRWIVGRLHHPDARALDEESGAR